MSISRRSAFPLAFHMVRSLARAVDHAETPQMHLALLPIYTKHRKAPSDDLIASAGRALEKTYRIKTEICEAAFYEGTDDGIEVLAYLALRHERVMGVLSGPLRARTPSVPSLHDVCGYANTPSDDVRWPQTSIITMNAFWTLNAEHAKRALGVVAVHELGHNFGAWDCYDKACLMYERIDTVGTYLPSKFCRRHADGLWQYLR
jgi:hypothetical protein